MTISPEDILTFWFDEAGPQKWFEQSDAFDAEVRERFGALTHQAVTGSSRPGRRHRVVVWHSSS